MGKNKRKESVESVETPAEEPRLQMRNGEVTEDSRRQLEEYILSEARAGRREVLTMVSVYGFFRNMVSTFEQLVVSSMITERDRVIPAMQRFLVADAYIVKYDGHVDLAHSDELARAIPLSRLTQYDVRPNVQSTYLAYIPEVIVGRVRTAYISAYSVYDAERIYTKHFPGHAPRVEALTKTYDDLKFKPKMHLWSNTPVAGAETDTNTETVDIDLLDAVINSGRMNKLHKAARKMSKILKEIEQSRGLPGNVEEHRYAQQVRQLTVMALRTTIKEIELGNGDSASVEQG